MKKDFSTALTGNGTLIVAAVGRERPEFLQGLTKVILRNGGNILETRAQLLAGDIAILMLVDLPLKQRESLSSSLEQNKLPGIQWFVHDTTECDSNYAEYTRYQIYVDGADHPGIIHSVSHILSKAGCDIEKMKTKSEPSPTDGSTLFRLKGRVWVPNLMNVEILNQKFAEIEEQEQVKIVFDFHENQTAQYEGATTD